MLRMYAVGTAVGNAITCHYTGYGAHRVPLDIIAPHFVTDGMVGLKNDYLGSAGGFVKRTRKALVVVCVGSRRDRSS